MTHATPITPDELVARAKGGDREAFGELYELMKTSVWRWVYRSIGDPAVSEEVVAECFVSLIHQLHELPDEFVVVAGWLRRVALNKSCDVIRRRQTRRKAIEVLRSENRSTQPPPPRPHETLERLETTRQIHVALSELPDEYQIVIQWRYYDDLSLDQIAARLNQSVSAANSLLYRARLKLRTTLTRYLDEQVADCRTWSAQGGRE